MSDRSNLPDPVLEIISNGNRRALKSLENASSEQLDLIDREVNEKKIEIARIEQYIVSIDEELENIVDEELTNLREELVEQHESLVNRVNFLVQSEQTITNYLTLTQNKLNELMSAEQRQFGGIRKKNRRTKNRRTRKTRQSRKFRRHKK